MIKKKKKKEKKKFDYLYKNDDYNKVFKVLIKFFY